MGKGNILLSVRGIKRNLTVKEILWEKKITLKIAVLRSNILSGSSLKRRYYKTLYQRLLKKLLLEFEKEVQVHKSEQFHFQKS